MGPGPLLRNYRIIDLLYFPGDFAGRQFRDMSGAHKG